MSLRKAQPAVGAAESCQAVGSRTGMGRSSWEGTDGRPECPTSNERRERPMGRTTVQITAFLQKSVCASVFPHGGRAPPAQNPTHGCPPNAGGSFPELPPLPAVLPPLTPGIRVPFLPGETMSAPPPPPSISKIAAENDVAGFSDGGWGSARSCVRRVWGSGCTSHRQAEKCGDLLRPLLCLFLQIALFLQITETSMTY